MSAIWTLTVNPAVDKSAAVEHVTPERKLRCSAPRFEPGGGGLNVSRAIRNLGGASTAAYLAGGPEGAVLRALLDEERLTQMVLPVSGRTRENLIVFESQTGQQYRFGMPGPTVAEGEWRAALDTLFERVQPGDFVVASGSLSPGVPADFYAQVAKRAKAQGAKPVVDTSGEALRAVGKEGVHLLKCNLRELGDFTETKIESDRELEEGAGRLRALGTELVLISLGAGGALFACGEGLYRLASPTVPIQSKVGAGDSMLGGMVLALVRGRSPLEAARHGVATGAAAVMTPGTELCRREDAERLLGQVPAPVRLQA